MEYDITLWCLSGLVYCLFPLTMEKKSVFLDFRGSESLWKVLMLQRLEDRSALQSVSQKGDKVSSDHTRKGE